MERTSEASSRAHAIGGGIIAGLIAGLVLEILLAIMTAAKGGDIWMAMKGAAAPLVHERTQQPGLDGPVVLLGLVAHFTISAIWGLLFSLVAFGLPKSATVVAGAFWGIVVWLGMYYVVLPIVGLGAIAHSQPIANAVIGHVIFGLAVGLAFLPFQHTRPHAPATRAPAAT